MCTFSIIIKGSKGKTVIII